MIKIIKSSDAKRDEILNRKLQTYGEYESAVDAIIASVTERGDDALYELGEKFDKVKLSALEVSENEFAAAEKAVNAEYKAMLLRAAENITAFHKAQLRTGFEIKREGITVGQRVAPIEKVGIYVPGGTASYPSTVLMNAIPAKIAGVKSIIMCTPPTVDGSIRAEILVAAKIAGVDRVFKVGGAGAIAAMAFGTNTIPSVDKIVGPGNIFVALAKKRVFGVVGIDMVAGPSEILVVADSTAKPVWVAADMLSQAEHDKLATAVLVTPDAELASAVSKELERQLALLPRENIARASIDNNGKIILVGSVDEAIEIANEIAPEHLELCVKNAQGKLNLVKNAGSVFLGNYAPEALGDYYAGPNHTLPTSGSARFSSPLGVDDFMKRSAYTCYDADALSRASSDIALFAESEGLTAHAKSVLVREEL